MRKSTRAILKTAKAQQVQPESEEEDLETAAIEVTSANDMEDIYVNEEEEAAHMRKEEEEVDKNHRDKEGEQDDEEDEDEDDEPEIVQVVPQKRKQGKDAKKPTSKPFHSSIPLLCSLSRLQNA